MPEFAEVNTLVKWMRERVIGWTPEAVTSHRINFPAVAAGPEREATVAGYFAGATLQGVTQRGKFVVLRFSTGTAISHLMFSGRWSIAGDDFISNYRHHCDPPEAKNITFSLRCKEGTLNFHEPDYKGKVHFFPGAEAGGVEELSDLGPDVLQTPMSDPAYADEWALADFQKACGKSRAPIKTLLLDQKKQAGIGNMYACESLYQARIAPDRAGNSLSGEEVGRLHAAVKEIISESIQSRLDYAKVLKVYRKEQDPLGNPVTCDEVGGRDTFWVPAVQS